MATCPNCSAKNKKVLYRLHWSKRYHEFCCGNCRFEMDLLEIPGVTADKQLKAMWEKILYFEHEDEIHAIEKKINNMSEDEMSARLDELNRKLKK